jgi:hypothetical protein
MLRADLLYHSPVHGFGDAHLHSYTVPLYESVAVTNLNA